MQGNRKKKRMTGSFDGSEACSTISSRRREKKEKDSQGRMGRLLYRQEVYTIELPRGPGGVDIIARGPYKVPDISPGQTPVIGPDIWVWEHRGG